MWRRRGNTDLEQRRQQGEAAAAEARQLAEQAEPTLRALERRRPRNGIYEEVLATLRPRPRGTV